MRQTRQTRQGEQAQPGRRGRSALAFACLLALLAMAACGGGGNATTTAAPTTAAPATEATTAAPAGDATSADATTAAPTTAAPTTAAPATTAEAPAQQGFAENVTIEIPVYERAFEGWNVTDNYYTRWIQDSFGTPNNVTVKYVAIGRSTEVPDYQQMLAAHQAPEIIFHYDMPQALAYYSEGVMQELDYAEIQQYAPAYWGEMGSTIEQYGSVGGEKVFFFAKRPEADNNVTLLRKDWVEKAGYKVEDLTSLEKLNEMLLKWKELGLGKLGANLVQNNFTYSYPFRDWPIDEKERALYSDLSVADFTWKATEDFLRNLNYQHNNGLVDSEFYLRDDTESKWKAEFVAGKVGTLNFHLASNTDAISATLANDPSAEFALLPPAAGVPEGKQPQGRGYWPFGMIMGINYESSENERIATWMLLDWMSQPDNLFTLQNGVAGQNYALDAQGLAVKDADYAGDSVMSQNNNKDYWCLVIEGAEYADPAVTKLARRINWTVPGYDDLTDQLFANYEATAPYRTPDALFTVILPKVAEYKADLNELWKELYVKCATCDEAEFDATYAAAKQTFLDAGYQEILDEKQAFIDAGAYA
jgi:hypothetical protein